MAPDCEIGIAMAEKVTGSEITKNHQRPTPTVRLRSPLGKQIQLPVVTPPCLSFLTP